MRNVIVLALFGLAIMLGILQGLDGVHDGRGLLALFLAASAVALWFAPRATP